ncbi:MAG: cell division protein FtsQ/DivIB [Candidatus Omnitrophota bacterium]
MLKRKSRRLSAKLAKEEISKKIKPRRVIMPVTFIIVLIAVFWGVKSMALAIVGSDVFKLRDCYVKGETISLSGKEALDYCVFSLGANILQLDLETLRDRIYSAHPELREVRIKKNYPDTINVVVAQRLPFARIDVGDIFTADEEGFILDKNNGNDLADLPVINGMSRWGLQKGVFTKSSEFKQAVGIIKLLNSAGLTSSYKIKKINVSDLGNVSFYIDEDVEIKLGKDDFEEKIKKMKSRLINLDLSRVKYVDLRFKDLIVGPK